jgi:hypothetical protein
LPAVPKNEKPAPTRNQRTATAATKSPPPKPTVNPPSRQSAPAIVPTATTTQTTPNVTTQQLVTPPQQQPVVQKAIESPKESPAPPAPKAATTSDLGPVVEAYARALESKDINAVRRIYPGISGVQQRNLVAFFQIAKDLNVTFRIEDLSSTTTSAEATLAGRYDYVNSSTNDEKHVPVSFAASFQRDGNVWRLSALR